MIKVTRFNGKQYIVNADLIEFIEETPDTVLSLTTGRKVLVTEDAEELVKRVIEFRRRIHTPPPSPGPSDFSGQTDIAEVNESEKEIE